MSEQERGINELMRVLTSTGENGQPRFTDADLLDFVPLLVLGAGPAAEEAVTRKPLVGLMTAFAERVGLQDGMEPAEMQKRIDGFYEDNPPNQTLLAEVQLILRELSVPGANLDLKKAAARLIGQEASTGVLGGGERPAGSLKGGLMAQVLIQSSQDKKS